jgi:hypothetical protein
MAATSISEFILGDEQIARGKAKLQSLSPMLFGGVLPVVLTVIYDPFGLGNMSRLLVPVLVLAMMIAVGLYAVSVMLPGELAAVVIDPAARMARMTYQGVFASRTIEIPLGEIAGIKSTTHYDDDGYRYDLSILTLRDGERLVLPQSVTAQQIKAVRAVLGL